MSSTASATIAIAGGGIGGLAASIALRNAGFATEVFERQPRFTELGVAVGITPNGFTALRALGRGLAEDVCRRGRPLAPEAAPPIRLASGRVVAANPYGSYGSRHGAPFVNIRRVELLDALLAAHGTQGLHADAELASFDPTGPIATARFADDRRVQADVLVGADGIGSAVRAQLFGATPPRYIATYLRGIGHAQVPEELAEGSLTIGDGLSVFSLPLPGSDTYRWTAVLKVPADSWPRDAQASRAALLDRVRDWPSPCADLVASAAEDGLVPGKMFDRPPLTTWGEGPVTLLGDAAHPMNKSLGQGANTTLEDAVALASCLAAAPTADGLRAYEQARIPRTTRIVLASAETSEGGSRRAAARPADDPNEFSDWLYGWSER